MEHARCILSRCQKGRDGKTALERLHGKRPTQEFVPVRREGAGNKDHRRSDEQDERQISIRNMAWNEKQQCRNRCTPMFSQHSASMTPTRLRSAVRNSCGTDVKFLTLADLHWSTGLQYHRLVPKTRTFRHGSESPSSTFLLFAPRPGPSHLCGCTAQRRGLSLRRQLLARTATAPIQLRAHSVVECYVVRCTPIRSVS